MYTFLQISPGVIPPNPLLALGPRIWPSHPKSWLRAYLLSGKSLRKNVWLSASLLFATAAMGSYVRLSWHFLPFWPLPRVRLVLQDLILRVPDLAR